MAKRGLLRAWTLTAAVVALGCGGGSSDDEPDARAPDDGALASAGADGDDTGGANASGGSSGAGSGAGGVTGGASSGGTTGGASSGGTTGGASGGDAAAGGATASGGAGTGGVPSSGGAGVSGAETVGGASPLGGAAGALTSGGAAGAASTAGGATEGGQGSGGAAGSAAGDGAGGAAGSGGSAATITRRVLVVIFEPHEPVSGAPLWQAAGYEDPDALTAAATEWWAETSDGRLEYIVVETRRVDDFPVKADGFDYDYAGWQGVMADPETAHQPDQADYDAIIADADLCARANAGEVDELWLFGGPYFGFAESALAGPGAFPYNGPSFAENACARFLPIMGFNYERGLPELLHDFGHRAEATMTQVFGGWAEDRTSHDWDRFGLVAAQSPSFGYSGCGSVHYPPNAAADYDYARAAPEASYCDAFLSYPALPADLAAATVPVSCEMWGCTEDGYLRYWFRHLPHAAGVTGGISNDWWAYFIDPNRARSCDAFDADGCAAESRCALYCGACFASGVDGAAACSDCGLERTLEGCDAHGGCAWYSCGPGLLSCWPTGTDPDLGCSG